MTHSLVRPVAAALAAALLAAGAAGCAFEPTGVADAPALDARLRTRAVLPLVATSHVGVTATDGDGAPMPYVEPSVTGGEAVLRTTEDGWLLVEDLAIGLADVIVPAGELGTREVRLTDVRLRLGTQLAVEPYWSGDEVAAWGLGEADLLLDWSLVTDRGPWPMATQKLAGAEFTIAVTLGDDDAVRAAVATAVDGEVHELTGLVTFSDLSVAVDAAERAAR